MTTHVQVRGWPAILLILLVAGAWGFTRWRAYRTLDTEAVKALEPWLVSRYVSLEMAETGGRSFEQLSPVEQRAFVDRILAAGRVEIISIRARGSGDDIVCRVEVRVDGKPPPDGRSPLYFRMRYSNLTGWTFDHETLSLAYYLNLF